MSVNFSHPANRGLLRYLERNGNGQSLPPSCAPKDVKNPYYNLGTHPDVVQRLWDELAAALPPCAWVVYGTPALVHPSTGVVFAFAQGTGPYALRLPPKERAEAMAAAKKRAEQWADQFKLTGKCRENYLLVQAGRSWEYAGGEVLDLDEFGPEWVFGRWLEDEPRWCKSAFDFAGMDMVTD